VLENEPTEILASAGSLAYVRTNPGRRMHVVDLERGRVIATRTGQSPRLLPTGSHVLAAE
jgi:hypothetical protein